jgi:hypothetical protein
MKIVSLFIAIGAFTTSVRGDDRTCSVCDFGCPAVDPQSCTLCFDGSAPTQSECSILDPLIPLLNINATDSSCLLLQSVIGVSCGCPDPGTATGPGLCENITYPDRIIEGLPFVRPTCSQFNTVVRLIPDNVTLGTVPLLGISIDDFVLNTFRDYCGCNPNPVPLCNGLCDDMIPISPLGGSLVNETCHNLDLIIRQIPADSQYCPSVDDTCEICGCPCPNATLAPGGGRSLSGCSVCADGYPTNPLCEAFEPLFLTLLNQDEEQCSLFQLVMGPKCGCSSSSMVSSKSSISASARTLNSCKLCSDGSDPTDHQCASVAPLFLSLLKADDDHCSLFQSVLGPKCGCSDSSLESIEVSSSASVHDSNLCTLCADGSTPSDPDCASVAPLFLSLLHEDDNNCPLFQSVVGPVCGCPDLDTLWSTSDVSAADSAPCSLCADGSSPSATLCAGFAPTILSLIPADSNFCPFVQAAAGPPCGCNSTSFAMINATTCAGLCSNIPEPNNVIPTPFGEATCSDLNSLLQITPVGLTLDEILNITAPFLSIIPVFGSQIPAIISSLNIGSTPLCTLAFEAFGGCCCRSDSPTALPTTQPTAFPTTQPTAFPTKSFKRRKPKTEKPKPLKPTKKPVIKPTSKPKPVKPVKPAKAI